MDSIFPVFHHRCDVYRGGKKVVGNLPCRLRLYVHGSEYDGVIRYENSLSKIKVGDRVCVYLANGVRTYKIREIENKDYFTELKVTKK